jgi:hypothetical protein
MSGSRLRVLVPTALSVSAALLALPSRLTADDWCHEDRWGRDSRGRHCEVRETTFRPGATLSVDARPNGGIDVRTGDGPEVRLLSKVVVDAPSEEEAALLAREVRIETGETVRAVGPAQTGRHRGYWVSFRLEVPRGVAVDLRADNGGLSLRDFAGKAVLHTVNGGLHIERASGDVHGDTVNGGVHVRLSGKRWEGAGLDLRTTNGGLHVEVPDGYNARLEMGTVNGGIHSDIAPTEKRRWSGGRIDAELGQGGPPVRIETTNGGLHLTQG